MNIMHNKTAKFITRLPRSSRAFAIASHCRTDVSVFSAIYSFHADPVTQPLSTKLCKKFFFRSVTFNYVKIFYQNSIIVTRLLVSSF